MPAVFESILIAMRATVAVSADSGRGGVFPSTHWSVVLTAAQGGLPAADAALASLCQAYWHPLYAFVRKRGHTPEEAEDLTQEFLARLVHKDLLKGLTQEGGKFRSFLLTALKRFMANEWQREHAQKRGGGLVFISLDHTAEAHYQSHLADGITPEILFERQWAVTVLNRVLSRVQDEYGRAHKQDLFARLQNFLPGAKEQLSYAEVASALQLQETAVRMATHRLRRRYGQLLREEIAATVSTPDEIDEEIRHLIAVAGHD
jgi:RNA polymerase sigma factor (sigma-70 family)